MQVLIANETEAAIDADRLEAAVHLAFAGSKYTTGEISVAIVDDATIHRLNRQFLTHDYPTDVLSFPLADDPPDMQGEIIASVDTAARCAAEVSWAAEDELLLYVVHGALHLAGYADKSAADAAEMRSAEAAVLAKLGVPPAPGDGRWRGDREEPTT
ncbi:MAG: rRNA maturation RNase YbeY [Pirellulales bacterium]|nr:rRNA maturation RNase YbeY [Pirellulales bacterium]